MSPTMLTKLVVTGSAAVLAVGTIDAAMSGEWDLFVVMLVALTLTTALAARVEARRPAVPLRRDLVVWLRRRAGVTGEPMTVLADRAIASYRDAFDVGERSDRQDA